MWDIWERPELDFHRGAFTLVGGIIFQSNMPGGGEGGAIYSLQLTYYSISSVINWHVSLVGLSILCVCACVRVVLTCWMVGGRGLPHPPTPWLSTADLCFLATSHLSFKSW